MPATENVWRNLKKMHVVFAVSAVALLFVTIWMMIRDFDDEWRGYQRQARRFAVDKVRLAAAEEQAALDSGAKKINGKTLAEARADAVAQSKKLESHENDIKRLQKEKEAEEGTLAGLTRNVKFARAKQDVLKADLGLLVRDLASQKQLQAKQAEFDKQREIVADLDRQLLVSQAKVDDKTKELAKITKARDDARAEVKKLTADLDRLTKTLDQLQPPSDNYLSRFKLWLMEQPIVDGFNGPFKINQVWLPELKINYGGMSDVARFDRCITCHVNIDKYEAGNVPSYAFNPHGLPHDPHHPDPEAERHASNAGYKHPYASHSRPDLYMTDASPHRIGKFGCTSCHDGQGSGTSFQNASHTPSTIGEEHHWSSKHGYAHNHFWEAPMSPLRMVESGCIKCHHNVVELESNKKYGNSAPKVVQGYNLVRKFGCFGCHEINGYNVGRQIGPDMRLEPQTADEAARIAADPNAIAGTMRKVGPGLRHLASKTNKAWTRDWVSDPTKFRPETRMPKFFHLTGQLHKDGHDPQAEYFEPVEIQAITEFLFARSEKLDLDHWTANYKPDMNRGKDLFSKRGCLACHEHDDFKGIKQDFGPNLTNVYAKLTRDPGSSYSSWLYTWLRNPANHSSRTKMPDLFLDPYTEVGEGGKSVNVDPAADIMAFLLSQPGEDGKRKEAPAPADPRGELNKQAVDDLVVFYLKKSGLSEEAAKEVIKSGKYPKSAKDVKGDEIELADKQITDDVKLQYLGRRSVSRYGCYGCHDIPEFEKSRPIGTALQDWGRKDPSKLAMEHIEEYLDFYGEKDSVTGKRSSTRARVEQAVKDEIGGTKAPAVGGKDDSAAAFFYQQLQSHGRAGFLWQKLREPRSYDYATLTTKAYDERLRMPQFPFTEQEIEAIATFVLGLVADPPAEKFVYRPTGAAKARIDGEKALTKFNCTACHMIDLPEITYESKASELTATDLLPSDIPAAEALLKKLKPPRDVYSHQLKVNGKDAIRFQGLIYKRPDPQDPPEDQEYSYDLWEVLKVGEEDAGKSPDGKVVTKDKLVHPGTKMLVPAKKLIGTKPARGGTFAEWLVEQLITQPGSDGNRFMAWQASPPPLYQEGIKVQTPWLFRFLKDPPQLRFTTVLRMPRFNMSDEEAQALADYFAAYDGAEYPYQSIPQREPEYLSGLEKSHKGYLPDTWKLLNAPLCIKCHSVGGQEYRSADPKKDIRGPNLDRVTDRLRPDWTMLWLYKPAWITPYTSMPQPFPNNQQQFPELFKGNAHDQTVAARDALMNYMRLIEKEGKLQLTDRGNTGANATPAAPEKIDNPGEANPGKQAPAKSNETRSNDKTPEKSAPGKSGEGGK